MKKTTTLIFFFLCSFLTQAWAQDSPHWTVDSHDFQYDMTAYLSLTADGEAVTDYSNYEIAAFCGDELRGVAEIQTSNDKTYAYMRIRSNQASGDVITFKVYVKDIKAEVDVKDYSITFASMDVKGMPSSPVVLDFVPFIPGDVNADGKVSSRDLVDLSKYFLSDRTVLCKNMNAADMDGNGTINNRDLIAISKYILTNN